MKQLVSILSFVLLMSIQSNGQTSRTNPGDGTERIVKMYPNPATTVITFDLQKDAYKGFTIQIYSLLGKKMYETGNTNGKVSVNLQDYNRGAYIYHLIDKNGKLVESGKFQVSH